MLRRSPLLQWDAATHRYSLTEPEPPLLRDGETVRMFRSTPRVFSYRDYQTAVLALGFSRVYRAPFIVHVNTGRGRFALTDQLSDTAPPGGMNTSPPESVAADDRHPTSLPGDALMGAMRKTRRHG